MEDNVAGRGVSLILELSGARSCPGVVGRPSTLSRPEVEEILSVLLDFKLGPS
jgi:hypothetical protein